MSNQIFCIFCHFLTNWQESWLISENLNVVANGAGTFLVVTLYGAETFFCCIHTGHEVFLDSHFYGAHTFFCICSTGQYVFWPLYLRGTSFFWRSKFLLTGPVPHKFCPPPKDICIKDIITIWRAKIFEELKLWKFYQWCQNFSK